MQVNFIVTQDRIIATLTVLALAAVFITPLCGYLFMCGCDWPWSGLDSGCNYFQPQAHHKCPWCVSLPAAMLAGGLALLAAIIVLFTVKLNPASKVLLTAVRTLVGFAVFVLVASLIGAIDAYVQHYPLGVGSYWYS